MNNAENDQDLDAEASYERGGFQEYVESLSNKGMAMIADFPGVGGYVGRFRESGLHVEGPMRAESIALGIAGYLVATKPSGEW